MSHCLSDKALFECYSGEGEPDALAHLKTCLACAGRFKVLQGEMTLISHALEMAPPRRRAATARRLRRMASCGFGAGAGSGLHGGMVAALHVAGTPGANRFPPVRSARAN